MTHTALMIHVEKQGEKNNWSTDLPGIFKTQDKKILSEQFQ